jgi:hypothetical protein
LKTELSNKNRKDNVVTTKVNHTNSKKSEYDGVILGHDKGTLPEPDKANFSGKDSRVKVHETTGANAGATVHSQFPPASVSKLSRVTEPLAVRVRSENPAVNYGGTHTTSEAPTPGVPGGGREKSEEEKAKLFGRGSGSRRVSALDVRRPNASDEASVPKREMDHTRNFSSPAGRPAPNEKKR